MKVLSVCAALAALVLSFSGCKNDHMIPEPAATPDPREVYIGNYHFTIVHTSSNIMNPNPVTQTSTYDGSVSIDPSSTDGLVIAFGAYNGDTIIAKPGTGGNFTPQYYHGTNSIPNSSGSITTAGHVNMGFSMQSPGNSYQESISGDRTP